MYDQHHSFMIKIRGILKTILQYSLAVIVSLAVALLFRLFVVDFYSIPSDSMEPSIESGDFILVNKLSFGARMYKNFDFLKNGKEPEMWRMKGYAPVRHGDVLVFNFPYSKGWNQIRMHLSRFYVKRCIGVPGDTLCIREAFYEINGKKGFGNLEDQQMIAHYGGEFPQGIYHTIPFDPRLDWTILNMGPLYIPRRGDRLYLDTTACRLYHKMIEYESGIHIYERDGQVYGNDSIMTDYTFRSNWYFMGGDNMWNSQDSRYIGLIPEEFIVGKAVWVLTAKDPETQAYKWKRFFTKIK
ncbi:MAG: signal peptidase I [Odoribacter sp.]